MNREADRVAVPTNGRKPSTKGRKPRAVAKPSAPTEDAADVAADDPVAKATSPELTIAVTPAQLAVGFGVIAGIVLLVLGRRRGRRRG